MTMPARLAWAWVAAIGIAAGACGVDETGYLVRPEIDYTADVPLEAAGDSRVVVVGTPGALTEPAGALTVTNTRSSDTATAAIDAQIGSFAAQIDGRQGDSLRLVYELDGSRDELTLELADALDQLAEPDCPICGGSLLSPPDADGNVTISFGQLAEPTPPFLITNLATGFVLRVDQVSPNPVVPGDVGDEICFYRLGGDTTSPAHCSQVPAPIL